MAKRSRAGGKSRPEAEALLDAVRTSPDNDTPRLIMADWLEEHGDGARAEFIRAQIELTLPGVLPVRQQHLRKRERSLLLEHFLTWTAPLEGLVRNARFRRGFVEQVTVTFADLMHHGGQILVAAPVSHLIVVGAWPSYEDPMACPHLARVHTLEFRDNVVNADAAELLAECRHLRNLRGLILRLNPLGDAGLTALARARNMPHLETLDLYQTDLNESDGVEALANSPLCENLTRLVLGSNRLGDGPIPSLARTPHLGKLQSLHLAFSSLSTADVTALSKAETMPSLRHLDLSYNQVAWRAARALAAAPRLQALERLGLMGHTLGRRACGELRQRFGDRVAM